MSTSTSGTPARGIGSAVQWYALSALCVAAAVAVAQLLQGSMDATPLFFAAVMLGTWFGGRGPGLFAVLLATLAFDFFFAAPLYKFSLGIYITPRFAVFVMSALLISWLSDKRKRAEGALRRARDDMEAEVRERTAELERANEKLQAEVAERIRMEEALRERASLLDLTHDTVFVRDMDDVITYWNRGAAELYGWTAEEATGQVTHSLTRTVFPAPLEEINEELLGTGRWEGELVHTKRDGAQVVVASRWSLQRDGGGKPVAILETNNDITERRRAEEALRESEEQWRAVFENNPTMYFMVDAGGDVLSVNPFGAEKLGYTVKELIGAPVLNVFLEADKEDVQRNVATCLEHLGSAMNWEARKVRKDGAVLWVRETARAVLLKNRPVVLVACEDITERKQVEEELRESEGRYRYIFQSAGVSIWEEDFSLVNNAVDELKAQGVRDFRQYLAEHPEFVRRALTMVKVIDVNDATLKLFRARSKDELMGSLDKVFLPETEEVFTGELLVLAEGETFFEAETALQTLSGERLSVLFTITFPPRPAKLDSVLVTIMDITERRRAEEALQKTQAELAHVTRVTTMGELASSIAHEVNQPLTAVVTNANACLRWLAGEPPNLDEARETVKRIVRDGHRASEVIGRVRALFKKNATDKARLNVNELIQDSVALVHGETRRNRSVLRTELGSDLPHVLGDRVQLQQVLLNLIINGIEAMSAVTGRPRELVIKTRRDEAGGVDVSVRDSGAGINPEDADRLFDAFYTTKAEGMGMGLSVSRSIIEAHGGRLRAESNDGRGATFRFTLPADGEGQP
jgi:PAS domain S-box-containing protein